MNLTIANAFNFKLTVDERISKTRIQLRRSSPFFSYILEHLQVEPSDRVETIGVNSKAQCFYNEKFIETLPNHHLVGVLVHEVMHCALRHFSRQRGRNAKVNGASLWNIMCDAQINQMVRDNGFSIPDEGVIPVGNTLTLGPIKIENVSEKSAEELYEEAVAQFRKSVSEGKGESDSEGGFTFTDDIPKGFDEHLEDDSNSDDSSDESGNGQPSDASDEDGKSSQGSESSDEDGDSKDGASSNSNPGTGVPAVNWSDVLSKAHAHAKLQGREPAGFERMFADLHKPKVCWRSILRRTVASSIPEEFTWKRPHKKYIPHDIYLPSTYGETIKVVCAIDTSGSIDHETLTDFISEIVGISQTYHEAEFIILSHDVDVHDEIPVRNGYRTKLQSMELHGGGGTSHIPMFEHVEQRRNSWDLETTVVISFTDGYSSFPEKRPKIDQIVFVLAGGHCPKEHLPEWADVILTIE